MHARSVFGSALHSLCVLSLGCLALPGAQFYVSPSGSPIGDGSVNNPLDLATALKHPAAIKPGDTIWLRGGVYKGKFGSNLTGTAAAPITVRSYPGEWATIDGYDQMTLASAMSSTSAMMGLSSTAGLAPGHVLHVDNEHVRIKTVLGPRAVSVLRGWNGSVPAVHQAGASVARRGNILLVSGSHTWYWGFEVMSSDPVRITAQTGSAPLAITRGTGIVFAGSNNKLINVIVHDAADAIGYPDGATNNEIYGAILYHTGWHAPDRGHGHGIYIQSQAGTRHLVRDVISFNNFATGMKAFGMGAPAIDVTFDGVISFNNGSIRPLREPKETNLYVGTDKIPADLIQVSNSFLYHTPGKPGQNLHFGYSMPDNARLNLQNNYVVGGNVSIDVAKWQAALVTGNTFQVSSNGSWGAQTLAKAQVSPGVPRSNWSWDQNAYFDGSPAYSNGKCYTFGYPGIKNSLGGGKLSFQEWQQKTGFDQSSAYVAGEPAGVQVFVRPNAYEAGRAHVVVYNWAGHTFAQADLSQTLQPGDRYVIRDAQNYFGGPVVAGVYAGTPISIPMNLLVVSAPVGTVPTMPVHTAPHFGVFVVQKL